MRAATDSPTAIAKAADCCMENAWTGPTPRKASKGSNRAVKANKVAIRVDAAVLVPWRIESAGSGRGLKVAEPGAGCRRTAYSKLPPMTRIGSLTSGVPKGTNVRDSSSPKNPASMRA